MGAYALLGLGAVVLSSILRFEGSTAFAPYYGGIDPLIGTAAVVVAGGLGLTYLERKGWFSVRGPGSDRGVLPATALVVAAAVLLVLPVIGIDLLGGFPRDLNVELPEGLLFYPAIAVVAEVVFHVGPLAVGLGALFWVRDRTGGAIPSERALVWIGMTTVAFIEPAFQVLAGAGESPAWARAYVGFHLLAFNLVALALFRRRGFLTAYLFRLAYYGGWHLLWGALRLRLLF